MQLPKRHGMRRKTRVKGGINAPSHCSTGTGVNVDADDCSNFCAVGLFPQHTKLTGSDLA